MSHCPCQSNIAYTQCCKPLHDGLALAKSAEQLMRSRYCAFVMQQTEYILLTHSSETRHDVSLDSINQWNQQCNWLGLNIVTKPADKNQDKVEFIAWYKTDGKLAYHHELSQFFKHEIDGNFAKYLQLTNDKQDAWYYHSATFPNTKVSLPARNDICICGSGKKFKKCCGS